MKQPIVWTIAGSDSSAGAGLQADIKTMEAMGTRACSIVTALTAQSLQAVQAVEAVSTTMLDAQWQALSAHPPAAIKIGMLRGIDQVRWLSQRLQEYPQVPVVCDPVLLASDGTALQDSAVREAFVRLLLPRVTVLTPNVPEATWLCGAAGTVEEMARLISAWGVPHVLLKGGHAGSDVSSDYFLSPQDGFWMSHPRLPGYIHSSGYILAAAVAAALARGHRVEDAAVLARRYLQQGWRLAVAAGEASGDFIHAGWPLDARDIPFVSTGTTVRTNFSFSSMGPQAIGLYPVVDSVQWIERLLPLGINTIQLRIKQGSPAEIRQAVTAAVALGRHYHARVFINDYWQEAIAAGAYGVHLGQEDLDQADLPAIADAGLRLGLSNHSEYEIARSHALRPSYMAFGPVYETTTKQMRFAPQGLARLREWVCVMRAHYPLVAIGGIDRQRMAAVLETGVGNIAMVRGVTEAGDVVAAVRQLQAMISVAQ